MFYMTQILIAPSWAVPPEVSQVTSSPKVPGDLYTDANWNVLLNGSEIIL